MLIEFSVGNFLSIKDEVAFSMEAAKIKSRNQEINSNNVFEVSNIKLLKSAAIYGANASGKSNVLKALRFMKFFVQQSATDQQIDDPIDVKQFMLSTETKNKPSFFEVVFLVNKRQYRYGFEVDSKRVHKEWLYHVPSSREALLFHREKGLIDVRSGFKEGKKLEQKTRNNALFLSVVAQFNGEISISILRWFKDLGSISGILDFGYKGYTTKRLLEDKEFKEKVAAFSNQMDVGILDLSVLDVVTEREFKEDWIIVRKSKNDSEDEEEEEKIEFPTSLEKIHSTHRVFNQENQPKDEILFDIDEYESDGTQKLIYLLGPIYTTLEEGRVIIIDEFDARLHPLITMSLLKLFNSNVTNPKNAQLIFATHDTNLLTKNLFRRDQIWFTEKNQYGATDLYSLAEINVRNDASFEKDYISGKYGAIPFLGNLDFVLGEAENG